MNTILLFLPIVLGFDCTRIKNDFELDCCPNRSSSSDSYVCKEIRQTFKTFQCCQNMNSTLPVVETTYGKVRGIVDINPFKIGEFLPYPFTSTYPIKPSYQFLGIPYAKTPVRFKPPEEPVPWSGVLNVDKVSNQCMQESLDSSVFDILFGQVYGGGIDITEDCLILDVFTTDFTTKKPVHVFIHGGGFDSGSKEITRDWPWELDDMVYVAINYRLNAHGYLALEEFMDESGTSGNFGTLDQILALKWIQKNIAKFGGDPNQVVITGQSAGGRAVETLVASPLAKGLFIGCISMSGYAPLKSMYANWPRIDNPSSEFDTSADTTVAFRSAIYRRELRRQFGITETGSELISRLRNLPAETLVHFVSNMTKNNKMILGTVPATDGHVLASDWYTNPSQVPMMVTSTLREHSIWTLSDTNYTLDWMNLLAKNPHVASTINQMYGYPQTDDTKASAAVDLQSESWIAGQYSYSQLLSQHVPTYYVLYGQPATIFQTDLYGSHTSDMIATFGSAGIGALVAVTDETIKLVIAHRVAMREFIHTRRISGYPTMTLDPTDSNVFLHRQLSLDDGAELRSITIGDIKDGRILKVLEL